MNQGGRTFGWEVKKTQAGQTICIILALLERRLV